MKPRQPRYEPRRDPRVYAANRFAHLLGWYPVEFDNGERRKTFEDATDEEVEALEPIIAKFGLISIGGRPGRTRDEQESVRCYLWHVRLGLTKKEARKYLGVSEGMYSRTLKQGREAYARAVAEGRVSPPEAEDSPESI